MKKRNSNPGRSKLFNGSLEVEGLPSTSFYINAGLMTEYFLVLRIVAPDGEKVLGRFFLGDSREAATAIYTGLHGTETVAAHHFVFFDFIEARNGLPFGLKLLACSLDEAALNVKAIIKNLFINALGRSAD